MKQGSAIKPSSFGIDTSDSAVADAFSRLRVSTPTTLIDVQCQYNSEGLRLESGNTSDGVAPAFSANTRLVTLQVNAGAIGGTSFLQSFQYIPYQPGKSQMILMTGVMGTGVLGAVKRFGYGDAANGIFYEQNATSGVQFNRRTSTSGGVVNNVVAQSAWNLDKFDGTGPSGTTLDPTKCFILVIDLQFLGMGRVRVGFDIDGVIRYAHEFLNANILTVPYMQTASLPLLAEIIATPLGSTATSQFKCAAVVSEGGFEVDLGRNFSAQGTVTAGSGARTHILSLRPGLTFNALTTRGLFVLENIDILAGSNAVLWELVIGAAFSPAPTFAAVNASSSFMEAGTGGTFTNLTNGILIASGFIGTNIGTTRSVMTKDIAVSYPITLDRSGAQRALGTISLLLTGIGGTSDCRAAFNWREIR